MWTKAVYHVALLILAALFVATSATQDKLEIANFTTNGNENRPMDTINDPVMGGSSYSSQEQKDGYLDWHGRVRIVWFLLSPGFCILRTAGRQTFPSNLGDYSGISYIVSRNTNMLLPMSAQIENGVISPNGDPVTYTAVLSEIPVPNDPDKVELYAPWSAFTGMFHGQHVDAPHLDYDLLSRVFRVGLSTYSSHKRGEFEVKLYEIYAKSGTTESHRHLRHGTN